MYKIYLAGIWGSLFEWYDFTLYTAMASVLSKKFFPPGDEIVSLLGIFAIFAVGFISRHIGGLFFGYIGDNFGRKKAFYLSLIFMAIFTLLIGLLPIYIQCV